VESRRFKWNDWNIEHIALKGISPEETESVFDNTARGYPRCQRDEYMVRGKSNMDRWLQVVFLKEKDGRIFIFHARPLNPKEKKGLTT